MGKGRPEAFSDGEKPFDTLPVASYELGGYWPISWATLGPAWRLGSRL